MSTWKLYSKCETCPRKEFFVRKREIMLPIGQKALSKKLMCGGCFDKVKKMLDNTSITT